MPKLGLGRGMESFLGCSNWNPALVLEAHALQGKLQGGPVILTLLKTNTVD